MPASLENDQSRAIALPRSNQRTKILISGYYGFGNLGDEAILEQLTIELKKLVAPEEITVLSDDPEHTSQTFGVSSISRWELSALLDGLSHARLFISGGGGLFQDTQSVKSTIYYGGQIGLAKAHGVPCLIYAQGVGPLNSALCKFITRATFSLCTWLTVRDPASKQMLDSWGIAASLTADPVWCLAPTALPLAVRKQMADIKALNGGSKCQPKLVGLSLRSSKNFLPAHLQSLVAAMDSALPNDTRVVLLPLQDEQDRELLLDFRSRWQKAGRQAEIIDTALIERPSQWIELLSNLDLVIGMRLHALILALKSFVPIIGLAYDPKVTHLLTAFEQPILNLTNTESQSERDEKWSNTIKSGIADMQKLSRAARKGVDSAKNMACQNFQLLDRILHMQSDLHR